MDVEIVKHLKEISGLITNGVKVFTGGVSVIYLSPDETVVLYNPKTELTWDANGYLTEVRITGKDKDGNTRTFKRTLTWSPEGYLQEVSSWVEV